MKRLLSIALVVLICGAAYAQGVPSQSNPRLMVDSAGNLVSTTNPLPVTVSGGSSTPTAMDGGSTTVVTPTATPVAVSMLANVHYISFDATGTFEVYNGATAVTASSTPIYSISMPTGDGATIRLGQTATPTVVTIRQVGE